MSGGTVERMSTEPPAADPFGVLLDTITGSVESWLGQALPLRQVQRHPHDPNVATLTWSSRPDPDPTAVGWLLAVVLAAHRSGYVVVSWKLTIEQHGLGHDLSLPPGDTVDLLADLRAAAEIAPARARALWRVRGRDGAAVGAAERDAAPVAELTLDSLLGRLGFSHAYAQHLVQPYCDCGGLDGWERCQHARDLALDT